jgi:hypothetical protein
MSSALCEILALKLLCGVISKLLMCYFTWKNIHSALRGEKAMHLQKEFFSPADDTEP